MSLPEVLATIMIVLLLGLAGQYVRELRESGRRRRRR